MVIKIKLKGVNSISLSAFTCSKSTPKPCSKSTIETSKCCQRRHSGISIVSSVANLEHIVIGPDISLKSFKATDCSWTFNVGRNCLINNASMTFHFRNLFL